MTEGLQGTEVYVGQVGNSVSNPSNWFNGNQVRKYFFVNRIFDLFTYIEMTMIRIFSLFKFFIDYQIFCVICTQYSVLIVLQVLLHLQSPFLNG